MSFWKMNQNDEKERVEGVVGVVSEQDFQVSEFDASSPHHVTVRIALPSSLGQE